MLKVVRPSRTFGYLATRGPFDLTHLSRRGEKGRVTIGGLLLVFLLALAVYLGFQAAAGFMDYLALRDTVRLVVRDVAMAPQRVEQGKEKILTEARVLDLPIAEWQVELTAEPEKVFAKVRWQHPIFLWGYTIFLPFEIQESRSLR